MADQKDKREKHTIRDSAAIAALIAAMIGDFRREVEGMVDDFFPRASELGMRAADEIVRRARMLTPEQAEKFIARQIAAEKVHVESWMADINASVKRALDGEYVDEEAAIAAVANAFNSQAYRTASYAAAVWRVSHLGMNTEMQAQAPEVRRDGAEIEAWFTAFPEADVIETSCEGCIDAVAGNPYTPETCPIPGEFQCMFNCRHYIEYRVVEAPEGRSFDASRQEDQDRHIVQNHPQCPVSKPWGLVSKSTGKLLGCHATEAEAKKQEAAIKVNKK